MEFNVWDIGGPASMATVNQCFFTDKALYVVVWNLALGEEAVANLQFWLLNIEVRSHPLELRSQPPTVLWSEVLCGLQRKGTTQRKDTILVEGLPPEGPMSSNCGEPHDLVLG